MHEGQSPQAGNGGQGAGGDLGDGLAQSFDTGLPGIQRHVLGREPVAEDDGIVNGQGQLQHHRHGVGDEADLAAQKVRAHIQQGCRAKGHHQHRHLHIGLGGQRQHDYDDHRCNQHDDAHFLCQVRRAVLAHGGVHIAVVGLQQFIDLFHGVYGHLIRLRPIEAHVQQCRRAPVVVLGIVKGHPGDAVQVCDLVRQGLCPLLGHIGNHNPGRAVGDEIVIHDGQAPPGLRLLRQIGGDVIFHLDPVPGEQAEHQCHHIQQEKQVPLVHYKCGDLFNAAAFGLFFFFCHCIGSFHGECDM